MAEFFTLATPVTKPSVTKYRVTDLILHFDPPTGSSYTAILVPDDGSAAVTYTVRDSAANSNLATSRLIALNKINLSTNSLQKRILEFASTDGALAAGSVTGSPD